LIYYPGSFNIKASCGSERLEDVFIFLMNFRMKR